MMSVHLHSPASACCTVCAHDDSFSCSCVAALPAAALPATDDVWVCISPWNHFALTLEGLSMLQICCPPPGTYADKVRC